MYLDVYFKSLARRMGLGVAAHGFRDFTTYAFLGTFVRGHRQKLDSYSFEMEFIIYSIRERFLLLKAGGVWGGILSKHSSDHDLPLYSFINSLQWGALSKAFLKSRKTSCCGPSQ